MGRSLLLLEIIVRAARERLPTLSLNPVWPLILVLTTELRQNIVYTQEGRSRHGNHLSWSLREGA